jgi:hypothetical protein
MTNSPAPDDRRRYDIACKVFTTLLDDQIARSDSLNSVAGVLAGLGGVVTTLAGIVTHLTQPQVGLAGIAAAGASVTLAVMGLMWWRPGREPTDPARLLDRILHTGDVTLTEDVLLYADVAAALRNDLRLRHKTWWTVSSALLLAGGIVLIVIAILAYGS